jgi:predicted alpha-1,6-mannanase (GH76 family)
LFDKIKNVNQTNANCTEIRNELKRNNKDWNKMLLKNFKNVKNTLFYHDKLWVLTNESRLDAIKKVHDQSTIKHDEFISS